MRLKPGETVLLSDEADARIRQLAKEMAEQRIHEAFIDLDTPERQKVERHALLDGVKKAALQHGYEIAKTIRLEHLAGRFAARYRLGAVSCLLCAYLIDRGGRDWVADNLSTIAMAIGKPKTLVARRMDELVSANRVERKDRQRPFCPLHRVVL